MVASLFSPLGFSPLGGKTFVLPIFYRQNARAVSIDNLVRSCFILMLAMPLAAQQGKITAVVRVDARTGRLVRSVLMEPKVMASSELRQIVDRIANEQGVDSQLVHSVIRAESNYNATAISPKGAQGIMQLIPETARRFGVANLFDPQENILGGVKYLRFLLDYYRGDYVKTIAAYNAGEAAVDRFKGIPPYEETRNYVAQVARNLKAAREAAPAKAAAPQTLASLNQTAETPKPIETSTGSDGRIYYRTP